MKKTNLFLGLFLVGSIFASWTNKVSDKLLNPQKYFKKQKIRIYKNFIPVQTNKSGLSMWSGCKTDKGKYFETELECVIYNTNEGKIILLTDSEYANMPESPYKGFYRFYKFSKGVTKNSFLNELPLYASQSFIDNEQDFSQFNDSEKESLLKYRRSWTPLSVKMVVKRKDGKIIYIYDCDMQFDGVMLSKENPIAYAGMMAAFEKENSKWLITKGSAGTFFSNLRRSFGYNKDATKLIVE